MKKALIVFACIMLVLTLTACAPSPDSNDTYVPEDDGKLDLSSYEKMIDAYTKVLQNKKNGKYTSASEFEYKDEHSKSLMQTICDLCKECEPDSMGYAVKDINRDGVAELVLLTKDNTLKALFATVDSKPVLVEDFTQYRSAAIDIDGNVYTSKEVVYVSGENSVKVLTDKGTLEGIALGYGREDLKAGAYYKDYYGKLEEIDYKQYEELCKNNELNGGSDKYRAKTRSSGIRYVPAIDIPSADASNAVPLDFSSYDAIKATFKEIVSNYPEYKNDKWIEGEYDKKYSFADDTAYEWYVYLFETGYALRSNEVRFSGDYAKDGENTYGYDERDINGDGVKELLLLTDQYEIIAVFTEKNSKPVLLSRGKCLIDENGCIYVERYTSDYAIKIRSYDITEDMTLKTVLDLYYEGVPSIGKVFAYKIEQGRRVEIAVDEYLALLKADFMTDLTESVMRSSTDITFNPLFSRTTPSAKHIGKNFYTPFEITSVSESEVKFKIEVYVTEKEAVRIEAAAKQKDGRYLFECENAKGELDFCVNGVWLILERCEDERVRCGAFYYTLDND